MSDKIQDIAKEYKENVRDGQSSKDIGLFPIPEHPEIAADQGMWSAALDAILTTLRYLAPATLLTLFWGQQSFLFKLLKGIDSAFRAIVFSSEEQKEEVLKWLAEAGPVRVEHLDTVWRHGWILCGVLDAALPGACKGHPPTRMSLKHAQTIADHYLGVEPVFSSQELESNDALSRHQEWKLATYIDRIRKALAQLAPPVSKPTSLSTSPETTAVTFDYVARGSGLTAAQVNNQMHFKIYPTSQQSLEPGEITVLIRGPKDTYGMITIPPILGKAQLLRQKLLGLQQKPNFTETALPLTQGATYMRNFGKNNMNKTYFIPKASYDIDIEVNASEDHALISYVVNLEGKYDISITSRGQNIVGSPFSMTSSKNIIKTLEYESFCLEDGEEIGIVDVKSDRKVVLRIVDFVTEKMLLRENGQLEKITDAEAKILMSMDSEPSDISDLDSRTCSVASTRSDDSNQKHYKFNKAAYKVVQMNRVCKIITSLLAEKKKKEKAFVRPRSQQSIPDIVNSTFSEVNVNPFLLPEKKDKVIVPENISVSLRTEKTNKKEIDANIEKGKTELNSSTEIDTPDSLEKFESIPELIENDFLSESPELATSTPTNPFLNITHEQNYIIEKDLGSFVKTEYERNKSDIEETERAPIKIFVETIDNSHTPSPINITNPFVEPDIIFERPKTPVLKIITGEIQNREDSVFVDPKFKEQLSDEFLANEFINPFYLHHHDSTEDSLPTTDFIIGAPVSLPPIIRATTPEPNMNSIILTDAIKTATNQNDDGINGEPSSSVFSNPLHTNKAKQKVDSNIESNQFHSLDSTGTDNVEILSLSNASDNQEEYYQKQRLDKDVTLKKETWDSAYVSIDDSNGSPDSNNNDNNPINENPSKNKFSLSDIECEYEKMGPAEREIWESCNALNEKLIYEEPKLKWETKRPLFTPILEESDRSVSTNNDILRSESGINTVAFAELTHKYNELFSKVNNCSPNLIENKDGHFNKRSDKSVDSASVLSDVKRHAEILEGKISEVQANVTESVSVSQNLRNIENNQSKYRTRNKEETQFGDESKTNIVLEKKQYWDERIREIQAKSTEEDKTHRKRKLSARHLRQNDSLTKRRGKQIVNNFINDGKQSDSQNKFETTNKEIINRLSPISHESPEKVPTDIKLVEKWKNYWDNKLQSDKEDSETSCFRSKSPRSKESSLSPQHHQYSSDDLIEAYNDSTDVKINPSSLPVKQELPEEVFKAFETSPKRFFGTSRKQILNKIDTFLGKPSAADDSSPELSGANSSHDAGLVSSRISLFHTISKTEERPWARTKSQSMHNIFQRKDSERSVPSVEGENEVISKNHHVRTSVGLEQKYITIDTNEITADSNTSSETIPLRDKRSRLVQSINNKSFDDSLYKNPHWHNTVQTNNVKNTIQKYHHKCIEHRPKYKTLDILRKSSVSKSEMDIFSKITSKPVEDDLDKYKSCDELPKINVKSVINLYESVSKDVKMQERKNSFARRGSQRLSQSSSFTGAGKVNSTYNSRKKYKSTSETDESTTEFAASPVNRWSKDPDSVSSGSYEPRSLDSVEVDIVPLKDQAKLTTYVSLSDIELEIVENSNVNEKSTETLHPTEEKPEIATVDYKSRFKLAKQYFQSLEDVSEVKKPRKLNECEKMLLSESSESLENEDKPIRPPRRTKKNIKSHSMPSSELSKIWIQMKEKQNDTKLVKISEKFNVDDLFNDVMEGRLSRQGSLRGIPHKKAVLEAFRSMENLTDKSISSYDMAATQLSDFAKENQIKNAQTYLTEYPYLPNTSPSKYQSRLDTKAIGLISLKDIHNQKPRRNSVPDIRLNPSFTVQL
ncbi:hypothetical protein O0L34_g17358 [Tuta absoluta]|nr:hypothetical protein O0L34_g17358 [Tuta absoluta]